MHAPNEVLMGGSAEGWNDLVLSSNIGDIVWTLDYQAWFARYCRHFVNELSGGGISPSHSHFKKENKFCTSFLNPCVTFNNMHFPCTIWKCLMHNWRRKYDSLQDSTLSHTYFLAGYWSAEVKYTSFSPPLLYAFCFKVILSSCLLLMFLKWCPHPDQLEF